MVTLKDHFEKDDPRWNGCRYIAALITSSNTQPDQGDLIPVGSQARPGEFSKLEKRYRTGCGIRLMDRENGTQWQITATSSTRTAADIVPYVVERLVQKHCQEGHLAVLTSGDISNNAEWAVGWAKRPVSKLNPWQQIYVKMLTVHYIPKWMVWDSGEFQDLREILNAHAVDSLVAAENCNRWDTQSPLLQSWHPSTLMPGEVE